jgi:hypothetical protein
LPEGNNRGEDETMAVRAADVREVRATPEEIADWHKRYPRRKGTPYRVACRKCGKRMWLSGIGLGAHRRACPGPPPAEEVTSATATPCPAEDPGHPGLACALAGNVPHDPHYARGYTWPAS